MKFRKSYANKYIYILIAVLCLANLFFGVKVIKKIFTNKVSNESSIYTEEDVVAVFNSNDSIADIAIDQLENNNYNIEKREENIYLKLFSSSNAYIEHVYNLQVGDSKLTGLKGLWSKAKLFFDPKMYIKSQIPAIFKVFDTTTVSGNNIGYEVDDDNEDDENDEGKNNVMILEDIVFIEDPVENNEGQELLDTSEANHDEIQAPNPINLNHEDPYVLIYHTHGTESFLPIKTDNYHTTKREYNVLTLGEIIGNSLSENGHKVKHVDIYHDIPSYNESYARSLATLKNELKQNENLKIVFDIHRDGVDENASYIEKAKKESKVNINGKEVATFFMVIGPDNPNKDELIKFANYIKNVSDKIYPGLCKGIVIKPLGKFNQYLTDYYALIEVGSNLNTIEEAKESAKLVGEVLCEVIEGIKEN